MEAEHMALAAATQEALWLRQLEAVLRPDTHLLLTVLFCDNQSAIHFAEKDCYNTRTKHIDIKYLFLRENILMKGITIQYVDTINVMADVLTKATFKQQVQNCIKMTGLHK